MEKLRKLHKKNKLKLILLSILIILLFMFSIIGAAILGVLKDSPRTNLSNLSKSFNQTSEIFDESGKLLEKIESAEYRSIVPIDKVPKNLKNAFISIEDERFYSHHGVDIRGILGALKDNIKAGSIVRGGSTITQQLVKNVYLSNTKSLTRKIQEAYLALRVNKYLSKDDVLEAYLNRINLGQGSYGVQAAALTYFSKDVWDLNLAQCALISGIAKSPDIYPPFKRIPKDVYESGEIVGVKEIAGEQMYLVLNKESFERQKIVLSKMLELDYISKEEYENALNFDIIASLNPGIKKFHTMSSYSTDSIKAEASRLLSNYYSISQEEAEHKLFTGGYRIYSSIDENMQHNLEDIYKGFKDFININTTSNYGAKALSFSYDENKNIIDKNGNIVYFYKNNLFDENFNIKIPKEYYNINKSGDLSISKIIFNTLGGKLDIIDLYDIINENLYSYNVGLLNIPKEYFDIRKDYIIIDHNYLKDLKDLYSIDETENLSISKKYYSYESTPTLQPESSSVVIDNETGYIKAIIGGLDINSKNSKIFNRATQAVRSPGSLIKPFSVYLTLLSNGYTLGSVVDDIPVFYNNDLWPKNNYSGYKGLLTLRFALEYDSNVAAVEYLKNIGIDKSIETLTKLGIINSEFPKKDSFISLKENIEKSDETLDSLALGNMVRGLTNIDMAKSFSTIASLGNIREISSVIKIEDSSGFTIIESKKEDNQIFDKDTCSLLRDALRTNVTRGSAKGASFNSNYDLAGAVGTNKFNSDLWFTGFTNKYTVSSWIGADSPRIELNADNDLVIKLFKKIAISAHKNENPGRFNFSNNITEKFICQKDGKLATKLCEEANAGYIEKYIKGTEPTKYSKNHKKVLICNSSGRLAGEYCPKEDVEYRIFFIREKPYYPNEHAGIYPDDYEYCPSLYCNIHDEEWYKKEKSSPKKNKSKQVKKSITHSKKGS